MIKMSGALGLVTFDFGIARIRSELLEFSAKARFEASQRWHVTRRCAELETFPSVIFTNDKWKMGLLRLGPHPNSLPEVKGVSVALFLFPRLLVVQENVED